MQDLLDAPSQEQPKSTLSANLKYLYLEGGLLFCLLLIYILGQLAIPAINFSVFFGNARNSLLIATLIFYAIRTFQKPQLMVATRYKIVGGVFNLIGLSLLIISFSKNSFLEMVTVFYLMYFAVLGFGEGKTQAHQQQVPTLLFFIGLTIFVVGSSASRGFFSFKVVLASSAFALLSFVIMLYYYRKDSTLHETYVYYFPRQLALIGLGLIMLVFDFMYY